MKTIDELKQMEERELITEVLRLQERLRNLKRDEHHASQIHNYHFAGSNLLKLTRQKCMGSGVVLSVCNLAGKSLVDPVTISDGFSDQTINSLLDDLEYTFNLKTELKPIQKRLNNGR